MIFLSFINEISALQKTKKINEISENKSFRSNMRCEPL